jgi:hypothetical protein
MIFHHSKIENIKTTYDKFGFVGVSDLLTEDELHLLEDSVENSTFNSTLDAETFTTNDIVLKSKPLLEFCYKTVVKDLSARLLSCKEVEIQHSKYNSKPIGSSGVIETHQDFPFFPHTSTKLMAMNLYLDDTQVDNGCLYYYPYKEHLTHHNNAGEFVSKVSESDMRKLQNIEAIPFVVPKGTISFHHCLTPHFSGSLRRNKRRILIIQLRDVLNKQVGGALWRCSGIKLNNRSEEDPKMLLNGEEIYIRNLWEPEGYKEKGH